MDLASEPDFIVVLAGAENPKTDKFIRLLKQKSLDVAVLPSINNKTLIAVRLGADKMPASVKNADPTNPELAAAASITKAQWVAQALYLAGISLDVEEIVAYKSLAALTVGDASLGALALTPPEIFSAGCRAFYGNEALRFLTLLSGSTLALFTVAALSAYITLFYQHPLPWLSFILPLGVAVFIFAIAGAVESSDEPEVPVETAKKTRKPSKFAQSVYWLSALAGAALYLATALAIILLETLALDLSTRTVLVVHFAAVTALLSLAYIFWAKTIEWWTSKEGYASRDELKTVIIRRKFFLTCFLQLAFLLVGLVFVPIAPTSWLASLEPLRQSLVQRIFDLVEDVRAAVPLADVVTTDLSPETISSQVIVFVDWAQIMVVGLVPLLAVEDDLYDLLVSLVAPTIAPLERPVDEARRRVGLAKLDIDSSYALTAAVIVNIFAAGTKRFFPLVVAAAWLSLLVRALPQRLSLASSLGPKNAARRWYGNLLMGLALTAVVTSRFYGFGEALELANNAITPALNTPIRWIMPATIGGYILPYLIQNVVGYTPEPKINDLPEADDIVWDTAA